MKIALGILAGILAFNVFVVLAFFAYAIPKRRAVERRRMRLVVPLAPRKPHRRRAIAAAAVAAVLVTGTALANPAARDAVTAMVDTVARGLQIAPAEEVQDAQAGQRIRRQRPSAAVSPSDAPSAKSSQSAAILPSPAGPDGGASSPSGMGADVAPAGPATVTATTTSSSSIVIRWIDVVGETGFRVERSADGVVGWVQISSTDRDTTVSEDTGLAPDTTYYYRVYSTNAGVDSAASAVASATTGVDPASPTTVIATSTSSNSITLDWSDVVRRGRLSRGELGRRRDGVDHHHHDRPGRDEVR